MFSIPVRFRNLFDRNATPRLPITATEELRVHDLIAKTAHVTLKDTIRVMLAIKMLSEALGTPEAELLSRPFTASKPSEANSEACNETYGAMIKWFESVDRMNEFHIQQGIDPLQTAYRQQP